MSARTDDLSPEQIKVIGTIEKLLRLAAKNPNEAEASAAAAKAQDLMTAWNLDQAAIEENGGDSGKRTDELMKGGHYEWQRDLWSAVAKLNFCLYFPKQKKVWKKRFVPDVSTGGFKTQYHSPKSVWFHQLIGRTVNVRSATVQAQYLEQAIERITLEELKLRNRNAKHDTWANSFRYGMGERIEVKLDARRWDREDEERQKAEARAAEINSASTSTALTIATFAEAEKEANLDFMDPERQAKLAAERARDAEYARILQEQEEAEAKWAAENPEEARLEAARQKKLQDEEDKRQARNQARRDRYQPRGYRGWGPREKGDPSARRAGYAAGERVSIDLQADRTKTAGAIG